MGESEPLNLQDVVAELIDQPPDRRAELLAGYRLTDEQREEVLTRLRAWDRSPTGLFEQPAQASHPLARLSGAIGHASRVEELNRFFHRQANADDRPRYRVLEEVGRGGMGTVYKAEQRSPVRRMVAIKVIRPGYDTADVVARFGAERQALSRMDHPAIARMLDAGADDHGRPYFVMEYVPGVPVTQYADENKLSIAQRLDLFSRVCDAVAHAHTKAVLHRDIKASNVLAYTDAGAPAVKVIDFGVAKALSADRLTDRTLNTERGQAVGTYESMSPEQAAGSPDIDTRTDVYALGVLLYELLTGAKPFGPGTFARAADDEARRIIRDVEPPRPSTRFQSLGDTAPRIAAARQSQVGALARQLRTELEWIPLKAMRKERDRRYASAQQFAEDIQRYRQGKPLIAGPESQAYRLRKFARRHRAPLAAAAALALLAAGGASAYLHGTRAAQHSTEVALGVARAQKLVAEEQRAAAQARAVEARRRLADVYDREGWSQVQAGDPSVALLWFVRALETVADDPAEAENARIRIAMTLAIAPRLVYADTTVLSDMLDMDKSQARRLRRREKAVDIVSVESGQLLSPPLQHDAKVSAAKFSPDGLRVLTVSEDRGVRLWDAATGQLLTPPLWHEAEVSDAEFSPDGRRVLTVSDHRAVRLWDTATGQAVAPPLRHDAWVNDAGFSPDGRRVLTATGDGVARVWDAGTGQPVTPPLRHDSAVNRAEFSPDGLQVVTASDDYTARVWDAESGEPVGKPLEHNDSVNHAEFSPDGLWVVTASDDGTARVWDAESGEPVAPPLRHDRAVKDAGFSPDGWRVVTASDDGSARVWEADTGRPVTPSLWQADRVYTGWSPTGQWVATVGANRTLQVWDTASDKAVSLRFYGRVVGVSPDGRRVVVNNERDADVVDPATGEPITPPLPHEGRIVDAVFSPEGRRVATASDDSTARVWDADTGQPITPPLQHEEPVHSVTFSPDGRRLVTTTNTRGPARIWDVASAQSVTPPLSHDAYIRRAEFSPDGRRVVTASADDTARVWDANTGQPVTPPLRHDRAVNRAEFSPDGLRVVTASDDGTARLWNAGTGQTLTPPLRHAGPVNRAVFSPDGLRVLTASDDHTARLWDANTGQPVTPPLRHESALNQAHFSPDGRRVLTVTDEDGARLWDAATGQPLSPPLDHKSRIYLAWFSPDGRRLTTVDPDGARVWDARPEDRPTSDLKVLAELLAAQKVDPVDGLQHLTEAEWLARRAEFSSRYPAYFRPKNWFYEAWRPPQTQPSTVPTTAPATAPDRLRLNGAAPSDPDFLMEKPASSRNWRAAVSLWERPRRRPGRPGAAQANASHRTSAGQERGDRKKER